MDSLSGCRRTHTPHLRTHQGAGLELDVALVAPVDQKHRTDYPALGLQEEWVYGSRALPLAGNMSSAHWHFAEAENSRGCVEGRVESDFVWGQYG